MMVTKQNIFYFLLSSHFCLLSFKRCGASCACNPPAFCPDFTTAFETETSPVESCRKARENIAESRVKLTPWNCRGISKLQSRP